MCTMYYVKEPAEVRDSTGSPVIRLKVVISYHVGAGKLVLDPLQEK